MCSRNNIWVIFAIGVSLLISIITYSLDLPSDNDSILYLLSSVSQGLAAIFTLVFVITIFGAQMMGKFTAMDKMIDKWTISLMIIFAIGIIYPLMQLRTDDNVLNLNFIDISNFNLAVVISVTIFCVLSLIPYLIRVNHIMKYDGGVSKLIQESSEYIDSYQVVSASYKIRELGELGKSAVNEGLENEASNIVDKISELSCNVIDEKSFEGTTFTICKELREIGLNASEKSGTSLIPVVNNTIRSLNYIAIIGSDHKMSSQVFTESLGSSFQICIETLKGFRLDVNPLKLILRKKKKTAYYKMVLSCVNDSIKIYNKTPEIYSQNLIMGGELWVLGFYVKETMPEYAENIINKIRKSDMRDYFSNQNVRNAAYDIIEEHNLLDEFKIFEKMFDNMEI